MTQETVFAGIAAAVIASLGLWWFRLIMANVKKQPPATRFGVYALVWLAYFIATLVMIGQAGGR